MIIIDIAFLVNHFQESFPSRFSSNIQIAQLYRLPPASKNVYRSLSRCTEAARVWTGFWRRLKNAPPLAIIILIDTQAQTALSRLSLSRIRALTLARTFARCRRYALAELRPGLAWQGARSGPGERKTRAYYPRLRAMEGEGFRSERGLPVGVLARSQGTHAEFSQETTTVRVRKWLNRSAK